MNKTIKNFRKCAFCPHHGQQSKCCCKKDKKRQLSQKCPINRPNTIKNESMIDFSNYSQIKLNEINIPTLMAENSYLKSTNYQLRNDLLSVSNIMKVDKIPYKQYLSVSTSNSLRKESEQTLSDKLYMTNKKLQETVLKLDSLSRTNHQLNQKNAILSTKISSFEFQNKALAEQIQLLNKKLKKSKQILNESHSSLPIKQEQKILKNKYENMRIQNINLLEEIDRLKVSLRSRNYEQSISPEWIVQTSNKLKFIEHKIDNVDDRELSIDKINSGSHLVQQAGRLKGNSYFQLMHSLKEELALIINIIHTKTRRYVSVFDSIGNVENLNIKSLICNMMEGFLEYCMNFTHVIEKQLGKKIISIEKRMDYLLGKLQNFVLSMKNRELRKRSTSRSRILVNYQTNTNKNTASKVNVHCKSPLITRIDKQNFNTINRIDKTC